LAATVPDMPEATMFDATLPGARKAKSAWTMLAIDEMGAQLVSPRTRVPTSMSGMDTAIAARLSQTGMFMLTFWRTTSATVKMTLPTTTAWMGKSVAPDFEIRRSRKVRA